ncbi:hypothetical protein MNV49_000780 [Pseudohyphozyma bogoriensis]|nr:hypothetical protein MNV49_000780 [Pseudohyphozyma bogoriensis]
MPLRLASCVWAAAALLSVLPSLVLAGNDSHLIVYPDTTTLPYVIHLPSTYNTSTSTFPAILFLHGNGSLGGIDVLADQTTWDGVGLLMSEYDAGNTTGAQAEVAEGWIVILPLAPTGTIDWNETQVMEVLESAGGDSFTSTQLSTLLTRSSNSTTYSPLSVYAFAGTNDTQQPYTGIQSNLALMQSLPGASGANLSFVGIDGDHHDMTSVPFDEVGLWEWLKEQRRVVVQRDDDDADCVVNLD